MPLNLKWFYKSLNLKQVAIDFDSKKRKLKILKTFSKAVLNDI